MHGSMMKNVKLRILYKQKISYFFVLIVSQQKDSY